jgi:hypothetical protein
VTNTRDWHTWIASIPVMARHHSVASPSVKGRAWNISASGAAAMSTIVIVSRAM